MILSRSSHACLEWCILKRIKNKTKQNKTNNKTQYYDYFGLCSNLEFWSHFLFVIMQAQFWKINSYTEWSSKLVGTFSYWVWVELQELMIFFLIKYSTPKHNTLALTHQHKYYKHTYMCIYTLKHECLHVYICVYICVQETFLCA